MSDSEWPTDGEGAVESSDKTATVSERPRSVPREVPTSGTTLAGCYSVLEPLGEHGMSIVLAAHDAQLDRRVALELAQTRWSLETTPTRARELAAESHTYWQKLGHPEKVRTEQWLATHTGP